MVTALDGDTIRVRIDGEEHDLRYIGVDCVEPGQSEQGLGEDAWRANRDLVEGKAVYLETDVSDADRYGRLLRYVWVGSVMVNAELVRLGHAQARAYPPDVKHQALFSELESQARAAGRGMWAARPSPSPPDDQPEAECPYVGNKRSKKLHHAWCASVKMMSERNVVCFRSREEAIAQGYVPCKVCKP